MISLPYDRQCLHFNECISVSVIKLLHRQNIFLLVQFFLNIYSSVWRFYRDRYVAEPIQLRVPTLRLVGLLAFVSIKGRNRYV